MVRTISPFTMVICSTSGLVAKNPAAILSYGGCTFTVFSDVTGCWKLYRIESITESEKSVNGMSSITARSSVNGIGLGVELGVKVGVIETVRVVDGDSVGVTVNVLVTDWLHDCVRLLVGVGDVVWVWVPDGVGVFDGVGVADGVCVLDVDTVAEGDREGVAVPEGVAV
jgi:hypothetical protein